MSNNLRTRNGMPFNFVNGLKVRGMDIESLIPGIEGIPEAGSKYQFAGNGTNKSFTLPVSPYNKDAVDVYVKQLYVHPDDYTLVGDTVTLVEAPPAVVAGETYNVVVKVSLTTLNGYVNANRVSFEGENLDDILEKSKPLANYSNLRTYAGNATHVRIVDPSIAGFFYHDPTDTTSVDNGGTIIVAGTKRWKRVLNSAEYIRYKPADDSAVSTTVQSNLRDHDYTLPARKNTLAEVLKKAQSGQIITIACYGDSLTYGMDVSADGQATQINGSTVTRSRYPYPEALEAALAYSGVSRIVYNRGFPGDTAADGLTRWASASATDISFLMYGTNDGNPTRNVTIGQYKLNMAQMIKREIDKGAAVILLGPPLLNDQDSNLSVKSYSAAAKKLADEYDIGWIDSVEQLSTITNLWTDGVHLTSYAYNELGWHLSALFASRDAGSRNVCTGSIFYPSDYIGKGGLIQPDSYTGFSTKSGNVLRLTAGQTLTIGAYFEDDVLPVIHSYNSTASTSIISVLYAGNGAYRGIPYADLGHNPAISMRERLTCGVLRKGYRTLIITNTGSSTAYIEAIEFVKEDYTTTRHGLSAKSDALSGAFMSIRDAVASIDWWTAIDYSKKLTAPYRYIAYITQNGTSGLAVFKNIGSIGLFNDILFVFRSGNDLMVREIVGGVVTTNTYAAVFAAGQFSGEIELELTTATLKVYVDGVLKATKASPVNTFGYPGLMSDQTAKLLCNGAFVQGYVKGPY